MLLTHTRSVALQSCSCYTVRNVSRATFYTPVDVFTVTAPFTESLFNRTGAHLNGSQGLASALPLFPPSLPLWERWCINVWLHLCRCFPPCVDVCVVSRLMWLARASGVNNIVSVPTKKRWNVAAALYYADYLLLYRIYCTKWSVHTSAHTKTSSPRMNCFNHAVSLKNITWTSPLSFSTVTFSCHMYCMYTCNVFLHFNFAFSFLHHCCFRRSSVGTKLKVIQLFFEGLVEKYISPNQTV